MMQQYIYVLTRKQLHMATFRSSKAFTAIVLMRLLLRHWQTLVTMTTMALLMMEMITTSWELPVTTTTKMRQYKNQQQLGPCHRRCWLEASNRGVNVGVAAAAEGAQPDRSRGPATHQVREAQMWALLPSVPCIWDCITDVGLIEQSNTTL
jgi:hypothetical protein